MCHICLMLFIFLCKDMNSDESLIMHVALGDFMILLIRLMHGFMTYYDINMPL
jgi:hypothetical protein